MIHVRKIFMATKCEGTGLESFGAYPCTLRSLLQCVVNPCTTSAGGGGGALTPDPAPGGTEAWLSTSSTATQSPRVSWDSQGQPDPEPVRRSLPCWGSGKEK